MAPKKGQKKVSLGDFLTAAPTNKKLDWAGDDDFDLPTAPSAKPEGGYGGSSLDFAPDRKDRDAWGGGLGAREPREPRPDVPLPTQPPFTAFIGSMSFDSTESDLRQFFEGYPITSVRLVTEGFTGKSKGFGYVEFSTLDALKDALTRTGETLTGRAVRISVAEPPRTGGFQSAADDASQWRRSGPVATSGRSSRPGFGAGAGGDDIVLDRSAFGSKFNADQAAPRGNRFGGGNFDPNAGDDAANWRTGKATEARSSSRQFGSGAGGDDVVLDRSAFGSKVTQAPAPREQHEGKRGFGFARQDADVTLDRSTFGSKVTEAKEPRRGGFLERRTSGQNPSPGATPGEEADQWRRSSPLPPKDAKRERPTMKLQPRSTNLGPVGSEAAAVSGKASPFGAAKPVDNTEREREIQARLEERRRAEQEREDAKPAESESSSHTTAAAAASSAPKNPATNPWKSVPARKPSSSTVEAPKEAPKKAPKEAPKEAAKEAPKAPATGAWGAGRAPAGALERKLEETKLA